MVAISTDSSHWHEPPVRVSRPSRPAQVGLATGDEHAGPVSAVSMVLLVVGIVALTLVVAFGTVALGRALDSQRGITASGSSGDDPGVVSVTGG